MNMYLVTVESGAYCQAYHVKADSEKLAIYAANVDFQKENRNREITHTWAVKKDKA